MATPGMNPTPAPPVNAPGGAPPNAVGSAVSKAPPQMEQAVNQLKSAIQAIAAFTKIAEGINPEAAKDFKQSLTLIVSGVQKLQGAKPPGEVPAPAPQAETPEATS